MTDDLINGWEALKDNLPSNHADAAELMHDYGDKLADTLETQAAEIARLREVVVNYVDPFDVTPEDEAFVEAVQRAALEAKP